jgi:hypothetical protein
MFYKSTAALDSKEMSVAIERFRNYSNTEVGIYIPAPHEEEKLNALQDYINNYNNQIYL